MKPVTIFLEITADPNDRQATVNAMRQLVANLRPHRQHRESSLLENEADPNIILLVIHWYGNLENPATLLEDIPALKKRAWSFRALAL